MKGTAFWLCGCVEDLAYEVIAVDNGSDPKQRLTPEEVRSYGPGFHLLDMGPDADPSPTTEASVSTTVLDRSGIALAGVPGQTTSTR